jgi:aryl-alcohol dehydrogenase-like predicted oxidoreductase
MKTTILGSTGLRVSRIGLGGMPFSAVNLANGWNPYTPEGRAVCIATINHALDAGVTYLDVAPSYGDDRFSEKLYGEVMKHRRDEAVLATKFGWEGFYHPAGSTGKAGVVASVEESLHVLQTDHIDIIQIHGGVYDANDVDHILNGGVLDGMQQLKRDGKVRHLGFTAEDSWTGIELLKTGEFEVTQVAYNLIYQSAALHFLEEAKVRNIGVATMRSMTGGMLQQTLRYIAPEWQDARDPSEVALRFLMADSRVHVANIGMRWSHEVDKNIAIVDSFDPPFDLADLARSTGGGYRVQDQESTAKAAL